jgi:hypothetical protein
MMFTPASPAFAQSASGTQLSFSTRTQTAPNQGVWHTNLNNATAVLIGISPVAARFRFANGSIRTFSATQWQYRALRGSVNKPISFRVRHNVTRITGE